MSQLNFTNNFRYLLTRLGLGIVISTAVTGMATGWLHLDFWNYWWTLIVGGVTGMILLYGRFFVHERAVFLTGTILIALPAAGVQYALFYAEQEAAPFESLADYDPADNHRRFLKIDDWHCKTRQMGKAEVVTERRFKRRVVSSSKRVYVAIPMYTDTKSTEPTVWMALDFDAPTAGRLLKRGHEKELIRADRICCFERLAPSLSGHFRQAIDHCQSDRLKSLRDEAVFLRPLYEPFIPRDQWLRYSLYGVSGAAVGLSLLALCVRAPEEEEEEEDDDDDDYEDDEESDDDEDEEEE